MEQLPDLVRDSNLPTTSHNGYIIHTFREADDNNGARLSVRNETWFPERQIGGGGFGSVWLERCVHGRRDVEVRAVKRIPVPSRWFDDKSYTRELEIIAKFSNRRYDRCFVKSCGWYELAGTLHIAMEYLNLGDLQSYLSRSSRIPEADARDISFQLLEGIHFMHNQNFAHRDLKPGNILIKSQPPDSWWIKIADFGISKRVVEAAGIPSTMKGTPGFMGPELLGYIPSNMNADSITPYPADMWSTGEIIFQMVTKECAFQNPATLGTYALGMGSFPRSALVQAGISELGQAFIEALLLPIPNHRLSAEKALEHQWIQQASSVCENLKTLLADIDCLSVATPYAPSTYSQASAVWSTVLAPDQVSAPAAVAEYHTSSLYSHIGPPPGDQKFSTSSEPGNHPTDRTPVRAPSGDQKFSTPFEPGNNSTDRMLVASEHPYENKTIRTPSMDKSSTFSYFTGSLKGHESDVYSVAFASNGRVLASGSWDGTVRLWDASSGQQLRSLEGHGSSVWSVGFSPDGRMLASGSADRSVRLWDASSGRELRLFKDHGNVVRSVAFAPDRRVLASASEDGTIKLWNTGSGRLMATIEGHGRAFYSVAFSPDGRVLASGLESGIVKLWDSRSRRELHSLEGHGNYVYGVAFSPDGRLLASGSWDGSFMLWDADSGRQLDSLKGHESSVRSVAFAPDGRLLASGSWDGTVRLWDVGSGRQLRSLDGYGKYFYSVAFSPDGRALASGSADGTVRLWDKF